jgi:glycosyltransferase involved in cell wall biosynthesis
MSSPDGQRVQASHIAILTRGLEGGGSQRVMRHIADELVARGFRVDLLTSKRGTIADAPEGLRVHRLRWRPFGRFMAVRADPGGVRAMVRPMLATPLAAPQLGLIPAVTSYLRTERPDGLITATTYLNLAAIWARRLADVPTRVLVSERTHLSESLRTGRVASAWRWRYLPPLLNRTYPMADAVAGVTKGVARDLEDLASLPDGSVHALYNPVLPGGLPAGSEDRPDHPWLREAGGPPVVLSAGRLAKVKDFPTLIRAFARLRSQRPARLLVLGKGPEQPRLERLVRELGVGADVRFAGWIDNVHSYLRHASLFALSSTREGFCNVLLEALASGCPVVVTDCPGGPAEVLGDGRFGRLVPVGDDEALAKALGESLDATHDKAAYRRHAESFGVEAAIDGYLDALGFEKQPAGYPAIAAA